MAKDEHIQALFPEASATSGGDGEGAMLAAIDDEEERDASSSSGWGSASAHGSDRDEDADDALEDELADLSNRRVGGGLSAPDGLDDVTPGGDEAGAEAEAEAGAGAEAKEVLQSLWIHPTHSNCGNSSTTSTASMVVLGSLLPKASGQRSRCRRRTIATYCTGLPVAGTAVLCS